MSLFSPKYKNSDEKFLQLSEFYTAIGNFLNTDSYISRKQYDPWIKKTQQAFDELNTLKSNNMLEEWCKKTKSDPKKTKDFLYSFENVRKSIDKHNDIFITRHLTEDKDYLDKILKDDDPNILLDEAQREVVLSDEDYMLVVAGAGSGKTTTLEAKAKYLVDKKGIDPARILVISFTNKATQELAQRFKKIHVPAHISTFHSIGNGIISSNTGKHQIKDPGFLYDTLKEYLLSKLQDEGFINKIMIFFASYLDMPFDSQKSIEIYKRSLANDDFTTFKNDLDDFKERLTKKRITIRSERVRSIQECQIANFLYINGIDYEYEPIYPYCIPGSQKPYTPDFRIEQDGNVVYLEHYGINEDGTNWHFSPEELALYKKHIHDKEILHKKHRTKLICTYSNYNDGNTLVWHLQKLLQENGFVLHKRDSKTVYHEIAERAEDRYFTKLIQLLSNFINRFKTNNFKLERFSDFQAVARENKDERTLLFLDIARQCYIHYEKALQEEGAIDFEDMINNAADILDEKIKRKEKLPYDYIFIDEYQDISLQRFNLAEKLSQCSDAKITAVGDDWQSIYRFSGADITLFTDFEKKMGYAKTLYLTNTHRNSQELINIAGSFIMKNNLQKRKELKSPKHISDPVIVVSYDDTVSRSREKDKDLSSSPYHRLGEAIVTALENIRGKFGDDSDVLLLGRYNFDGHNLNKLPDLFLCTTDNRVICKAYPKMKIHFMTAHSSKGLGADNVIVVNGKDDVLGFPSKIEDDPVMKLVLKNTKEIDYAEERRLFYVALTRTKNRVYLITPKSKPSTFITELMKTQTNIVLNGPQLEENPMNDYRYKCPRCGYPLQVRRKTIRGSEKELSLYICSNDPEVCGFVTNDISGGNMAIQKCPDCESGYLIVKKIRDQAGEDTGRRMLGCTNYKKDGTGCNYSIYQENYEDTWEKISRRENNYYQGGHNLPLDKCVLAGYPVKDLLKIIRYATGPLSKKKAFSFTKGSLIHFLIGKEMKSITMFHLDEDKAFGCIDKENEKLIFAIVCLLIENGFLTEDPEKYHHIHYSGMELTDQLARNVFERFVS